MKVTVLNPEESKKLLYWWGVTSKVCYNTQTDTPEKVGKGCYNNGHNSGSRSRYILFQVDDCPRFTIDQAVRHEIGVIKNVQSFRYVNKDRFAYEIPVEIKDNEALVMKYVDHMNKTIDLYEEIQSYVLSKGKTQERANEQARYVLPMATHSSFVIGFTVEALIHYCNARLCVRTEDVHRELAKKIRNATLALDAVPGLEERLVPNCQWLLWCPEGKRGCGAYPTRNQAKNIMLINKRHM